VFLNLVLIRGACSWLFKNLAEILYTINQAQNLVGALELFSHHG
jgi:hypothetical protein